MMNDDAGNLPNVLDTDAVADLLARPAPVTIFDVRTPAEFASVHIPGSYNVPLDLLPEHTSTIGSAIDEPVVLVCRSGARARQAEQSLRNGQLPGLHVLDGGLSAWEAAGLPLNRGKQRWSLERQVRGVAGTLVLVGALAGILAWPPLGLLAAGVGAGLAFSALTDTCGMAFLLGKLPYNRGAGCDVGGILRDLASRQQLARTAGGSAQSSSPMRHLPVSQESRS
jgi:rhodanese-related sulfurtransferase